jgi:hypothetical protein
MISVELARGGQPVLKKGGRWLASSFDPVKEAVAWAKQAVQALGPNESILVLGLGSGYHVAELSKILSRDRYLVIESDPEIASTVFDLLPELHESRILVDSDWTKLVTDDRFRDSLAGVYRFAKYGPSCQMATEYYRLVENLLIGRDRISFLLQLKARPDIWALLDPEKVAAFGAESSTELVSILTLQKLFSDKANHNRDRQIWRVLEELVA